MGLAGEGYWRKNSGKGELEWEHRERGTRKRLSEETIQTTEELEKGYWIEVNKATKAGYWKEGTKEWWKGGTGEELLGKGYCEGLNTDTQCLVKRGLTCGEGASDHVNCPLYHAIHHTHPLPPLATVWRVTRWRTHRTGCFHAFTIMYYTQNIY